MGEKKSSDIALNRKAISAPTTVVVLTLAMLSLTSFVAIPAVIIASNTKPEGNADLLHQAIEMVYLSNPGTSTVIYLKLGRPLICDNNTVEYPPVGLVDPAGIIASLERGATLRVRYSINITPFSIPAGYNRIRVAKAVDGSIIVEVLK